MIEYTVIDPIINAHLLSRIKEYRDYICSEAYRSTVLTKNSGLSDELVTLHVNGQEEQDKVFVELKERIAAEPEQVNW